MERHGAILRNPAGFGLVVEAGLGSGVQAFRNFSMHAFPSSIKRLPGCGHPTLTFHRNDAQTIPA